MGEQAGRGIYLRGAIYWLNFQRKGKRQFISLETDDYAEAVMRAAEMRAAPELNAGSSFDAEIDAFLAYKLRKREFTASSAHGRGFILKAFARWCDKIGPEHVTAADVQAFYEHHLHEHSATTANSYVSILRSFFNWCVAVRRVCRRNPCVGIDQAEDENRGITMRDFCTEAERDKLIDTCTREDLKFVLFVGFHAGLRKREIIEARPFWFDLENGLLHLRRTPTMNFKDREERTIPMTPKLREFVKSYGLREPFMLRPDVKQGQNRYRYDFASPFHEHCTAQGMEWITPHTMRHTFASLLASRGRSLYKISIWLGDDPRVVDRRYARLKPNDPEIDPAYSPGRTRRNQPG
jgi:integrase